MFFSFVSHIEHVNTLWNGKSPPWTKYDLEQLFPFAMMRELFNIYRVSYILRSHLGIVDIPASSSYTSLEIMLLAVKGLFVCCVSSLCVWVYVWVGVGKLEVKIKTSHILCIFCQWCTFIIVWGRERGRGFRANASSYQWIYTSCNHIFSFLVRSVKT